MKRLFAMLLAVTICAGLICTPASAATVEKPIDPVIISPSDTNIVPFAASMPDYNSVRNLTATGVDAELINLAADRGSYSKTCYTTSSGTMRITFTFRQSGDQTNKSRTLSIFLYKYEVGRDDGWNPIYIPKFVSSRGATYSLSTASSTATRTVTFTGLDPDTRYFLLFRNTSAPDKDSQFDISADIKIKN